MRNLKLIGLAVIAALGVSSATATSALANYDSEAEITSLSGFNLFVNTFTTNKGSISCSSETFTGTQFGQNVGSGVWTARTITLHPSYQGCKAFGLAATVTTTGCNYIFNEANVFFPPSASMSIACELSPIVVNAGFGFCVVKIGSQSGLPHLSFTNEGSGTGRRFEVTFSVGLISYSSEGACGKESASNGTFTGSARIAGNHGIWVA